ncbi:glycosyltransferase family 39 protein [Breznakiellaceae bacterium SP9]
MVNSNENNDIISARVRKLLLIISCIGIAGCLVVLIPQVRSAIISFGESAIVHRILRNREKWNWLLQYISIAGLLVSGGALILLGTFLKYPASQIPNKKKVLYYTSIEIYLIGLFFLLVLVLAASSQAVWLDETYSLAPTRHSWKDLIRIQNTDVHPPLYFLILKLCADVFGENIFTMKLVSIVPTILTMVFVTLFLNKEFSHKTAVLFLLCFFASESIIFGICKCFA